MTRFVAPTSIGKTTAGVRGKAACSLVAMVLGAACAAGSLPQATVTAAPAVAASPSAVAPGFDQINVPATMLEVAKQALYGPQHEVAAVEYAQQASSARVRAAELQPKFSAGITAGGSAPFGETQDAGAAAIPTVTWSLPTGQGTTDITLGVAARTGYELAVGPTASVNVRIPLLAGPDTRLSASSQQLAAAAAKYQERQRQIVRDAVQAYYGLLQAQEKVLLAAEVRKLAELDLQYAEEQRIHGTLSVADLYRFRTALTAAIDGEVTAQRNLEQAKARLEDLLGPQAAVGLTALPAADQPVLLHVVTAAPPLQAEDWAQLARENRRDLQAQRDAVALAEQALAKARATASKELAFTAGARWPNEVEEDDTDLRTNVQIGVQATFHLSNPGRAEAVTSAELALTKAKLDLANLEKQIERSVRAAYVDVTLAERALAQARIQLSQDELNLSVTRERLDQGLAVARDLQAQELAVLQQASRVRQLEASRIQAYLALWHAAGLDPVQLRPRTP